MGKTTLENIQLKKEIVRVISENEGLLTSEELVRKLGADQKKVRSYCTALIQDSRIERKRTFRPGGVVWVYWTVK